MGTKQKALSLRREGRESLQSDGDICAGGYDHNGFDDHIFFNCFIFFKMKTSTIQKLITHKFGTITKFAKLAKVNRYELQKIFAKEEVTPDQASWLKNLASTTKIDHTDVEIHPEKLELLKKALNAFGGVTRFTATNPRFSRDSVNQILAGRRKRISPVVQDLFDYFYIE